MHAGVGRFTYENDAPEVTPETVFDVASLTKVVATTAAAMLLNQRGELDLDAPLGEILPAFAAGRGPGDSAHRVKIRHLLAHNSGLPGYVEFFKSATTPEGLMQDCLSLQVEAEPGARAEYSDPGFILLGKAIENRVGESLDRWTQREIIGPLKMAATGFCPAPECQGGDSADGRGYRFPPRRIQGEVQDENASVLNGVRGMLDCSRMCRTYCNLPRRCLARQEG